MKLPQNNITVVILTHRLDNRLEKAIESAQWAQEIVLVHKGELDLTTYNKILRFSEITLPTSSNFAEQRNKAMEKVKTDWVFFLDSDEWISHTLSKEIQDTIQQASEAVAFEVPRTDSFLGKNIFHGETKGVKIIRLIKKGSGEWKGAAHETYFTHSSLQTRSLKNPLFHSAHTSIHEFIQKINLYTTLIANEKTERKVIARSIVFPIGKFIYTFVIRLGFLDGYRGYIYSLIMAIHSSAVRIKRYEQTKTL